jgi:5-methylcytosine-specific restriction endonuclease McrA
MIPNGDHFEPFDYYRCDGCDASIPECDPHYPKSDSVHFCWDCSFRLRLITPNEYHFDRSHYKNCELGYSFSGDIEYRYKRRPGSKVSSYLKKPGLPKNKRFAILERDKFRCRYCGSEPGTALLQIDHVMPKNHGGSDDEDNLVTACADCNVGKNDSILDNAPPPGEDR